MQLLGYAFGHTNKELLTGGSLDSNEAPNRRPWQ